MIIGALNNAHNHSFLTLSKKRYLRTKKVIPTRSRELFKTMNASSVAPLK